MRVGNGFLTVFGVRRRDERRKSIPLVLTYHPFHLKVEEIVKRNFRIMQNDLETSAIFTDQPLTSFRHSKNIKDELMLLK